MVLLDTNVFIYFSNGTLRARDLVKDNIAYASVSKIEALGYPRIVASELIMLESIFDSSTQIELSDEIVRRAVVLRQRKNMELADAIIAAAALTHKLELWTANIDDFKHIEGLQLLDPLNV